MRAHKAFVWFWLCALLMAALGAVIVIVTVSTPDSSCRVSSDSSKSEASFSPPSGGIVWPKTYYINLDKRVDRRAEIEGELARLGIRDAERVPGVPLPSFGEMGCSKAHLECLRRFEESDAEWCVILEDDFVFVLPPEKVWSMMQRFFDARIVWDVVMLAGELHLTRPSLVQDVCVVRRAQTTSGYAENIAPYMVHRRFLKTLKENYEAGIRILEKSRATNARIDMYWKRLQPVSHWLAFAPLLGEQSRSVSDISGKVEFRPFRAPQRDVSSADGLVVVVGVEPKVATATFGSNASRLSENNRWTAKACDDNDRVMLDAHNQWLFVRSGRFREAMEHLLRHTGSSTDDVWFELAGETSALTQQPQWDDLDDWWVSSSV